MMMKIHEKGLLLGAALLLTTGLLPNFASAANDANINNNAGVQLNQSRRYLEEQRMRQRIEEERGSDTIEGTAPQANEKAEAVRFTLNGVLTTPSEILTQDEIKAITAPYIRKEVSINDLYDIVKKLNALYAEKGYLTCRAFLFGQTIEHGIPTITLVEGRTGSIDVHGANSTRASYIKNRLHLTPGQIDKTTQLHKDLLHFNGTNDVQLRIAMKAGKEPGTTDYVLLAAEPQTMAFGIFADNGGNKTTGEYRAGAYWYDRSLTGNRDNLFLSTQRSEGTKAFAASYSTPVNHRGTKIGANYSTNSVRVVDGAYKNFVNGHASAYSFYVTTPMHVAQKVKSQWGVEAGQQKSVSDFKGLGFHIVDDTVSTLQFYVDQVDYGKSTVFYQKHAYRYGHTEAEGLTTHGKGNFSSYILNTLYQKNFAHGQNVTLRLDGQYAGGHELPSAEQYYLGGIYSIRGYKQNLIGGDSGFTFSGEYAVPVDTKRNISAYGFFDGGHIYGNSLSSSEDRSLASAGIGVRANVGRKLVANLGVGMPFIRNINGEEQSRGRVFFNVNGRF